MAREYQNLADQKWYEWCEKNGLGDTEVLTKEQIERFHESEEFGDILASLTPENQVLYCLSVQAWSRLKKLGEEFKKEQAYYPLAFKVDMLLAAHEKWQSRKQVIN